MPGAVIVACPVSLVVECRPDFPAKTVPVFVSVRPPAGVRLSAGCRGPSGGAKVEVQDVTAVARYPDTRETGGGGEAADPQNNI